MASRAAGKGITPIAWLMLAAIGCSHLSVRPPPEGLSPKTLSPMDCTTSYAAPLADTIVALGLAASSAYLFSQWVGGSDYYGHWELVVPVAGMLAALGFGSSAVKGYLDVSQCRDFKSDYQAMSPPAR